MRFSFLTLLFLISTFSSLFSQGNSIIKDTLLVYYDMGEHTISVQQKKQIANYLSNRKIYSLKVEGYADYVGNSNDNYLLAQERAENVLSVFLEEQSIDSVTVLSKGEMSKPENYNNTEGNPKDRKTVCFVTYSLNTEKREDDVARADLSNKPSSYLDTIPTLKVGEHIILKDILFYLGKAVIIPNSFSELQKLKEVLVINPNISIELRGHVCCGVITEEVEGMPPPKQSDYNMELSLNRTLAVKNYLIDNGIDSQRVSVKGMGFLEPLYYPEENEAHRQLNRRIELFVIKNN